MQSLEVVQNGLMRGASCWLLIPALGAAISFRPQQAATYSNDIRPILEAKCVTCHHTDGLGPFPLQTYEQTKKRGDLVRQVAMTGQMPPTDAKSDYQTLTTCPPLDSKELVVIQEWFRLGMPKGADTPPIPGTKRQSPSSTSSEIAEMVGMGQTIPAEGQYARVVYPIALSEDKLPAFNTFKFQPQSPKAVRQVALALQKSGGPVPFTSSGIVPDSIIATWSDGFNGWGSVNGRVSIQKGDRLWVQIRAVPTGKVESAAGLVTLGFSVSGAPVKAKTLGNRTFTIESDSQVVLRDEWTLDQDVDLISALPEARFTTEQVKLTAKIGEETKVVFLVLTWDPVWPGAYNFREPIRLKKGTTLIYEAMINNSKHGHAAEDEKPKAVKFGPDRADELFWCHLTYVPIQP
jgi:hypothetical protein